MSVDDAFASLRGYARRTRRRLSDVAHAVVTDLGSIPELSTPPPQPLS